jgi:hypothetical protein
MLQRRVVKFDTKERFNVSFFEDDMIETVRQQIGIALDTHPSRLFILVGVKLPKDYYMKDPRRWEALFDRITVNLLKKISLTNIKDSIVFPHYQFHLSRTIVQIGYLFLKIFQSYLCQQMTLLNIVYWELMNQNPIRCLL